MYGDYKTKYFQNDIVFDVEYWSIEWSINRWKHSKLVPRQWDNRDTGISYTVLHFVFISCSIVSAAG